MRRTYAFESEGVAEEVKSQLEKVEDVVEKKCDSPEACDKVLEKIEDQKEKFDDALKTMAGAAKDCKDGKCDETEMAAKITPKMAELKEVAKEVGVASEGETVSEEELKNVKDYLEGAEEIVEAKKDELEKGGESSKGDDDDDAEDDDSEEAEAAESFIDNYMGESMMAMESAIFDAAMEGANTDALGVFRTAMSKIKASRKEMKAAAKAKDFSTAEAKANECATHAEEAISALNGLDNSVASAVIANVAVVVLAAFAAALGAAIGSSVTIAKLMGTAKAIPVFAGDVAKAAGKSAAIAGGAAAGSVGASSAVAKFLKRKGAVTEDGSVDKEKAKLSANDVNLLITGIRSDLGAIVKNYKHAAARYAKKGAAGSAVDEATEAMIEEGFDNSMIAMEGVIFDAAMEGTNINAVTAAKAAMKAVKASAKEMKTAAKAKDFATAKAKAEEAATHASEGIKAIDELDQSVGSAVIAGLIVAAINLIKYSAIAFVAVTAIATGVGVAGSGAVKAGYGAKTIAKGTVGAAKDMATSVGVKGAVAGAGVATGVTIADLAPFSMFKYAKKKGAAPDEEGNVDASALKVQPNEHNLILAGLKNDLAKLMKKYQTLAAKFGSKAGSSSSDEGEAASESFTGFIAACEAMQFGVSEHRDSEMPFLFD